ncbi:MAG: guanylate kinase [Vampirovibrio sp.]|nr:guanylate kinase [Vampirovibrio sp.]
MSGPMSRGNIYVVTGPSGVGKGTLCALLLEANPALRLSISATSRGMRVGEQDGVNYHFKTKEAFEAMIAHDNAEPNPEKHHLLEWAEYNGNYYGTPRAAVEAALSQGNHVLLEIETQGALQVKRKFPEARLIFIAPPGMEELERRLRGRGTEADADIENRLRIARHEMTLQEQFDHICTNADLQACLLDLREIIPNPSPI